MSSIALIEAMPDAGRGVLALESGVRHRLARESRNGFGRNGGAGKDMPDTRRDALRAFCHRCLKPLSKQR